MIADSTGRSAILEWVGEDAENDNDGSKRHLNVIWNNDDKNSWTIHSVVYNLTDKTVYWVGNEHYGEEAYTFRFDLKK